MQKNFKAKIITLQDSYSAVHRLALDIMKSSLSFDIVIAIARGGMFPARLMCDFLNIGQLTSMQVKHYQSGAEILKYAEIIDPVKIDISGKNVLIIDDVNDTGKTLIEAVNHVQSLKPALLSPCLTPNFKTLYESIFYWIINDRKALHRRFLSVIRSIVEFFVHLQEAGQGPMCGKSVLIPLPVVCFCGCAEYRRRRAGRRR